MAILYNTPVLRTAYFCVFRIYGFRLFSLTISSKKSWGRTSPTKDQKFVWVSPYT